MAMDDLRLRVLAQNSKKKKNYGKEIFEKNNNNNDDDAKRYPFIHQCSSHGKMFVS